LPVVGINHLGEAPLTSLFGARQLMPEDYTPGCNPWDVGPTPLPVFSSIEEARDLSAPRLDGTVARAVMRMGRYYREHVPPWVELVGPMPSGPFSAAMELRGTDILYDLVDAPELAETLILRCAEAVICLELGFRTAVGTEARSGCTNFAVQGAGLRLGEDSICALSPEMIERFCAPAYRRINAALGGSGHIHFCSIPHARLESVYESLLRLPDVSVASSQFGFDFYARNVDRLRGRLAIESFYGEARESVRQTHGSFRAWAREFVPRFKNQSGLLLYTTVSSVEEGREIWAEWEDAHGLP
jgi:hypothetical protein